jgi:molybdate-binding protein
VHLPRGSLRKKAIATAKQWLNPGEHRVIGFVTREMGLMVKRQGRRVVKTLQDAFSDELCRGRNPAAVLGVIRP